MDFKDIKELIELVDKSQIKSFEFSHNGASIRMSKNSETEKQQGFATTAADALTKTSIASVVREEIKEETERVTEVISAKEELISGNTVKAPIVGTFYASPSPDKDDFVKVGDRVKKGDVLCILEAMKVMNEVVSDFDGIVKAVMVENETLVEYGQPLFIIG